MITTIFARYYKKCLVFVTIFLLLFTFRLMYGYSLKFTDYSTTNQNPLSGLRSAKNYASKKYKHHKNKLGTKVDQKYEKIAKINTQTDQFESNEKKAREKIKEHDALIQFEQKAGNKGSRTLVMSIGVPPENFDLLYQEMIKFGYVANKQITKKDKTNEYKELNAKKASLIKTRKSLMDLKTRSGKVQEFIGLENRILDIENQLQNLGVTLGSFDEENEFCTIEYALGEYKKRSISLLHRVKVALEWSVRVYCRILYAFLLFFFLASAAIYVFNFVKSLIEEHREKEKNTKPSSS